MAERNPLVDEWIAKAEGDWDEDELEDLTESGVMNRYPGFDTSTQELLELKEMAGRLRQALLLRLASRPLEDFH